MANGTFSQTNFTGGKITDLVYGRSDLVKYYNSVSEVENMVVTKQGPLVRRPGTRHVAIAGVTASAATTRRLLGFKSGTDQSYVLELGSRYMRVFRDRDQVMDDGSLKSAGTSTTPFELETPYNEFLGSDPSVTSGTISSTAQSQIALTGFAWGTAVPSSAVPEGVARFTLTSSGVSGGMFVGMRVQVNNVALSDGTEARKVNGTHTVIAVDSDSGNNFDVAMPSDPGAGTTTSAFVELPGYAEVDLGVSFASDSLAPGDIIDVSQARDLSGGTTSPGYNGRFVSFFFDSISGLVKYNLNPVGGTADSLTIKFLDKNVSKLDYAQRDDIMFLRHEDVRPKEIQRVSGWSISDVAYSTMNSGTATLFIASDNNPHPFQVQDKTEGVYSKIIVSGCVPTAYNGCFNITAKTNSTVSYTIGVSDPGVLTTFGTIEGWQIVNSNDHDGPYEEQFTIGNASTSIDPKLEITKGSGGGTTSSSSDLFDSLLVQKIVDGDVGRLISSKGTATGIWANAELAFFFAHVASPISAQFYATRNERVANFTNGVQHSWKLGKWSHINGWPWTVGFFDSRLASAGSNSYPSSFWASVVSDINNHRPFESDSPYSVSASDAIDLQMNGGNIYWLEDTALGMVIGTDDAEFLLRKTSTTEALGPNNARVSEQTSVGSKRYIKPVRSGESSILFVSKSGRSVYKLMISEDSFDSFTSKDLSLLSTGVTLSGIKEMAYTHDPIPVCWACLNNGKIIGITIDSQENVEGWHDHVISGPAHTGEDRAKVTSITSIQDTSGTDPVDQLWMIVDRRIDGVNVSHIEYMEDYRETGDSLEDAVFMDSSIEYTGSSTTSMTGLDHLEGETVKVLADGLVQTDKTVSSGAITLDTAATKVQMGLAITSKMATLPIEYQNIRPEGVHKIKRAERMTLDVMDSQGLQYGMSETDLYTVPFDDTTTLHTGIIDDMNLGACYGRDQRIWVVNSSVFPTTIRSLSADVEYKPIEG